MAQNQKIYYLNNKDINKPRWDACMDAAHNSLIYGYSFYLDHMTDHWDGLVLNDYEAVMPLPWRKKWFIYYLYYPFLTAQLGLFGKNINGPLLKNFLDHIPSRFKLWDLHLNQGNLFTIDDYKIDQRSNYVLDLNKSYEEIYDSYRSHIKKNIKKAKESGCRFRSDIPVEQVFTNARIHSKINKADQKKFTSLIDYLNKQSKVAIYSFVSAKDEVLASAVFIFHQKRAYYLLVANHPTSRMVGASHALIDQFIKDHCAQDLVLDFEGSDLSNLAFFYSSFGALEEKYATLYRNRLPFYLRWLRE